MGAFVGELKIALGSKSGFSGRFGDAAFLGLAAGGWKSVPSEGRRGENGIVCGAVENLVARGGATGEGLGVR